MFICVSCVPVTAHTETYRKCVKTQNAKIAKNTWHTEGPVWVTMAGHDQEEDYNTYILRDARKCLKTQFQVVGKDDIMSVSTPVTS